MRKLFHFTALILLSFGLFLQPSLAEDKIQSSEKSPPVIELAILLDTSGSMQGLINQARTQLWTIVNELATAKSCR